MARLLIVSRSSALSARLGDAHEVHEHPVGELDALAADTDPQAEALVLDIGDPLRSVATVNRLRQDGARLPVLLVSGYQPEWEHIEAQDVAGVAVVPLPITRTALLRGIEDLLAETTQPADLTEAAELTEPTQAADPAEPAEPSAAGEADDQAPARSADPSAALAAAQPAPPEPVPVYRPTMLGPLTPAPRPQAPAGLTIRPSRLGDRPRKLRRQLVAPDTLGLVTDPLGPRTDPYGFPGNALIEPTAPASGLERALDQDARARAAGAEDPHPADLVAALAARVHRMQSVSEVAQLLSDDLAERSAAAAAAVLVPDAAVCRVSGGVGLRALELRLTLDADHWLIRQTSSGRATLIDDTDIVRAELAGAPLASWRHLLAVPLPDDLGLVLLARASDQGPFTENDLAAVISPIRESVALLRQAIQVRELARALSEHADLYG